MPRVLSVLAAALGCCGATSALASDPVDPWQGFNVQVFEFNEVADRLVLRPVAQAWRVALPEPLQRGIHNALRNLDEPGVALNQLLQGKPLLAANDAGRFVLNTTVGLGGLLDVASPLGLPQHDEDFGQTLAVWGLPSGPFLTLPFFGPSTPSNAVGLALDMATQPTTWIGSEAVGYSVTVLGVVDTRVQLLDAEALITGDKYTFLRDAYLQRRAYLEADGNVEDPFLDDEEFEDVEGADATESADTSADASAAADSTQADDAETADSAVAAESAPSAAVDSVPEGAVDGAAGENDAFEPAADAQ